MGHGIANAFASHGFKVNLYEAFEPVRNKVIATIRSELEFMAAEKYIEALQIESTLANITLFDDLAEAVKDADYIIEATPENLELKKNLFRQLDILCPEHAILASNTSSLPLGDMIEALPDRRKERTMICHWYNPAHIIPIAELSFFGNMSEEVFNEVYELYVKVEKVPIKVLKDIPGLIANRMLHALAREVFSLIEQKAASPEDIDNALKFGPGFRSATTGMLEVADMGGLDLWCAVEDNLFKELNKSDRACDLLRKKVSEGNLGMKSGQGFFTYTDEIKASKMNDFNKRLILQLKTSKNY